ncbi:MAG: high-affinity branched-chain amino acid ABC transporter permease LivM, partial [Candidatus Lambdaproteobacteria bacterium]|nr:high-affinity branched-chain amino acid ABC transporter permease LivM [Candidatus Lambdaproteobacteria bacterium]
GPTFHGLLGIAYDPRHRYVYMYLLVLAIAAGAVWVFHRLRQMPMGRAWEALREDEIACKALGIDPTLTKLSAFTLGATFGGVGGICFAAMEGFINPSSFTFIESALILSIVVLGGMGSIVGVLLAAVALTLLPELFRQFEAYRMLVFGLAMVFVMVWRPGGLLQLRRRSYASAAGGNDGG